MSDEELERRVEEMVRDLHDAICRALDLYDRIRDWWKDWSYRAQRPEYWRREE